MCGMRVGNDRSKALLGVGEVWGAKSDCRFRVLKGGSVNQVFPTGKLGFFLDKSIGLLRRSRRWGLSRRDGRWVFEEIGNWGSK